MNTNLLFVYGTLRRETRSEMYQLLAEHSNLIGEGTYQGRLYKIDYYPGVVPSNDPDDRVKGEVYALREPEIVLPKLDQYEECGPGFPEPTEYIRRLETVTLQDGTNCLAWVYIYNYSTDGLAYIASGDFVAHVAG